jgi:uncharacterized phage protein gp47/JayE
MSTIENGAYNTDTVAEIEELLLERAQQQFDEPINDGDKSLFRLFYRPVAEQLAELQNDVGLVLESAQIDNAEEEALDLLVALVGVYRQPAEVASGEVRFYRDSTATQDRSIAKGTVVYTGTDSGNLIQFQTTEFAKIASGTTEVVVPVDAVTPGLQSNVAAETVTEMVNSPPGVQSVINDQKIQGGVDREDDDALRERAKTALSEGSRATADALITAVKNLPGTGSVRVFPNYEYGWGSDPGFELVAVGGDSTDIAKAIVDTKAVGDKTYSGNFGTAYSESIELVNGQTFSVEFSRPTNISVVVEADVVTEDSYSGDDVAMNNMVEYVGGTNTNGQTVRGDLSVGDDVLAGEIEYALRSVEGVYNVTSLNMYNAANMSTTTTDITVGNDSDATLDVADITITHV